MTKSKKITVIMAILLAVFTTVGYVIFGNNPTINTIKANLSGKTVISEIEALQVYRDLLEDYADMNYALARSISNGQMSEVEATLVIKSLAKETLASLDKITTPTWSNNDGGDIPFKDMTPNQLMVSMKNVILDSIDRTFWSQTDFEVEYVQAVIYVKAADEYFLVN